MKPGPATSALATSSSAASLGTIASASARGLVPARLGQHHRRIGREIAMRGIARRLDRDRAAVEPGASAPSASRASSAASICAAKRA